MDRPVVIKWKYKVNHPKSDDNITGYIDYISSQVKERRESSGRFLVNGEGDYFGKEPEISDSSSISEVEKYLDYMDSRAGSHELFSSKDADINAIVEELKCHDGTLWIPIVSLKEDWAKDFGLTSEADWIKKGRELAEIYRQELGISEDNFGYVAAFHTKPEIAQNKETDAGCQPHLHFILYEKEPDPHKSPTIRHKKLEDIYVKTANVLSRDYMKKSYELRNELREKLTDTSGRLYDHADEIHQLLWDIHALTKGNGKLSVGEFEKASEVVESIIHKQTLHKPLNNQEQFYTRLLGIKSIDDSKRAFELYQNILSRLDALSEKILGSSDAGMLLEQWRAVSENMRSAQGLTMSKARTDKDLSALKRQIENSILKETRHLSSSNRFITKKFKGMMLEKMEFGSFKQKARITEIMDSTRVISTLFKEMGLSKDDAKSYLTKLLETTEEERKRKLAMAEMERIYKKLDVGMDVSTVDFWNAMRTIGIDGNGPSMYEQVIPSASLCNLVLLEPIAKQSLRALDTTADFFRQTEQATILSLSLGSLTHVPVTKEKYEQKYDSLMDIYSSFSQSLRYEREMDHEEEI